MYPSHAVYLEVGGHRTFVGALDWPGWCRSGRDEAGAVAALLHYGGRYATAMSRAGITFAPAPDVGALVVVERLTGGSGTDFGVPSAAPGADATPLDEDELARQVAILEACWASFDAAATAACGLELRTGPRGGGRSLEKIESHVREAEEAYLGQLGARPPQAAGEPRGDPPGRLRAAIVAAFVARSRDQPVPAPSRVVRQWSPRYFMRRAAWHVLDHAWEIEDRAIPRSPDPGEAG